MARRKPKNFAWSFSALNSYETCAFKHLKVAVIKEVIEPQSPEATEGNVVHDSLENRLLKGQQLPIQYQKYEKWCKAIEAAPGSLHPEVSFTITRNFEKTEWNDWANAWLRVKIDVLKVNGTKAWIGDWKTGKRKDDFTQLGLFAAMAFLFYPEVQEIKANYIWLKEGKMSATQTYTRDQYNELWAEYLNRAHTFEVAWHNDDWPTKRNGLCRDWCQVKKLGMCPEFPNG